MPNWNQERPAPKELRKLLKNSFPEIKLRVPDGKGGMMHNYQIFKVRNVEVSNTPSAHSFFRFMIKNLKAIF